jgi:hypothetical protein
MKAVHRDWNGDSRQRIRQTYPVNTDDRFYLDLVINEWKGALVGLDSY